MYQTVTRNITVTVTPKFLPERSSQEKNYFFWAYTIAISNQGEEAVQLKTRHWRITDALGRVQEVRGAGVVGEEPVLEPGASYEYTSGVPLPTPSGFIVGTYGMVSARGERFDHKYPATPDRVRNCEPSGLASGKPKDRLREAISLHDSAAEIASASCGRLAMTRALHPATSSGANT